MRFAVGITLYNPTDDNIKHIKEYADLFNKIFIYDNSEPEFLKTYKFEAENIIYISNNKNDGLPYAYNKILESEEIKDCDYLCTLDQDSIFTKENIVKIQNYIRDNEKSLKEITGIVAPFISYNGETPKNENIIEKEWVITSGSFLNLYLLRKFNLKYDENYFIDKFEIDLCKQIKLKNLSIKMFNCSILYQSLGESSSHNYPNHSPIRHYYLFRNRFYFNRKFYGFIKRWILNILQTFKHCVLILLYEKNPKRKIFMLPKAYRDYKLNLKGKMVEKG